MRNFKWDKKYLYWGVTVFSVVVASITFFWVLNKWSDIKKILAVLLDALAPFIYGILISYLLNKLMMRVEKGLMAPLMTRLVKKKPRRAKRVARVLSVILTELLTWGVLAGMLVLFLPQIYRSIASLVSKSQSYFDTITNWVNRFFSEDDLGKTLLGLLDTMEESLMNWLNTVVLPQVGSIVASLAGGAISFLGTLMDLLVGIVISIYVLYNKETFCAQVKKVAMAVFKPRTFQTLVREMNFINNAFGDYIAGTLTDALIIGVATYIFMLLLRMPYSALIAIIIGVTNIIPFFGPFIGAVPSALLLLLERPVLCLIFVIFIVVLQQLDGNVIKPRIHGSKTGISGFWIIFAILFFGALFGVVGMILGVPVTSVLYSMAKRVNNAGLRKRGLPVDTSFYKRVSYVDPDTGEPVYKEGFEPQTEAEAEPQTSDGETDSADKPASKKGRGK